MLVRAQHTEVVRRAFNLFDKGEVEALLALYHPRVEMRIAGALRPPAQVYSGLSGAREYLQGAVDDGMNRRVDDLELIEEADRVIVHGRLPAPADVTMRWHFDFEDDLIVRVVSLEADWAALGEREFTPGRVGRVTSSGTVVLHLDDRRSLVAPVSPGLQDCIGAREPVMAYFDGETLAGWYLPAHQRGMDLR